VTLGRGLASTGARVQLVRVGSGDAASEDAQTFATYLFASSPGAPVSTAPAASSSDTALIELDAGARPLDGVPAVVVVRGAPTEADTALGASLGDRLVGTVATHVLPGATEDVARKLTNAGLRPLALIEEDRRLTAPSVAEIRDALGARTLYAGENEREVVEDVLIAPVYADPARPHFRRFASKAVLAPFNKTDLHLAAIETQAACLVITGGRDPSPYVLDRVQGEPITLLLAPEETPETVNALGEAWSATRFRGERKAEALASALEGRIDYASLAKKLT
jgi:BioD-like phosphotransacetylase family protein